MGSFVPFGWVGTAVAVGCLVGIAVGGLVGTAVGTIGVCVEEGKVGTAVGFTGV